MDWLPVGVLFHHVKVLVTWCLLVACATAGRDNPSDGPTSDGPTPDVELPPDANSCVTQPCDILTECGCPANQACDIDDDDLMGTACRTVGGTAKDEDGACSVASGCKSGLVCIGQPGHCRAYCDDTADCGSPRGICAITITANGQPIPGIPKTCTSNCDPVNAAAGGCPATEKCGLFTLDVNGVATNIVDCEAAGNSTQGQSCTNQGVADDRVCAKDHVCVTQGANNTCRKTCVVGETGICTAGVCTSFTTAFIVGGKNYGFCP